MSAGSVLTTRFVRHFKVTDLSVSFDQTDLRDPLVVAHLKRMISERLELVKRNLLHPFALCIRSIFLGLKDIIDRSQHDVLRAAFQAPAPPSSTADRLLVGKTNSLRIHFLLFLSDRCKKKPPVSSSNSLISSSSFLCRYSIRLSSICPPAFPPQSVKLQSLIHAGSLYAVFCAQKNFRFLGSFQKWSR